MTVERLDRTDMIESLRSETTATCDGPDCERALAEDPELTFQTEAGKRCAYECACGAVTITVVRGPESTL